MTGSKMQAKLGAGRRLVKYYLELMTGEVASVRSSYLGIFPCGTPFDWPNNIVDISILIFFLNLKNVLLKFFIVKPGLASTTVDL